MTYDPKFTSSSQSSFDAPDDAEKYVLATIPREESNGLVPTILLVSLLLLVGLISLLWVSLGRPAIPLPTPTPTATERAITATVQQVIDAQIATPNQRSTEVIELIQTRAAFDLANERPDLATIVAMLVSTDMVTPRLILTPAVVETPVPPTSTPIEVVQATTATPVQVDDNTTEDDNSMLLPFIGSPSKVVDTSVDDSTPVADSTPITATAVITSVNVVTQTPTANIAITETENVSTGITDINLPIIVGPEEEQLEAETPTDEPATTVPDETIVPTVSTAEPITATTTLTPTLEPTETPTETPTEKPTEKPTETPTAELIVEATATPTPTPTNIPPIFAVLKGKAVGNLGDIKVYKGPSRIYETDGVLSAGKDVNISDRDPSGEWLYVCCSSTNASGWVRQVEAPPTGNLLSDILGEEVAARITATPEAERERADDVRWLTIRNAPTNPSLPIWPTIPADHYVLHRYNPGNQANGPLPQLITGENLPAEGIFIEAWSPKSRAQGPILTTASTTERGVYITSEDGNLYQRRLDNGEEQTSYNFGAAPNRVAVPVAIFDQTIYAASSDNELFAISEQGLEKIWSRKLLLAANNVPLEPLTGINILADKLFLGATDGATQYLVSLDRRTEAEGEITFTSATVGNNMQFPAIGNQLVYVGNERISAFDAHDGSVVWQAAEPQQISAPPVYSAPGIVALAELYVAADQKLFALDANTGKQLWSVSGGGIISGLALGESTIYASIGIELKSFARTDGEEKWTRIINSPILGGPYVNGDRMLVVSEDGFIHYLNTLDGSTVFKSAFLEDNARHAPAVTSKYIFIPGENNKVFAWQGQ